MIAAQCGTCGRFCGRTHIVWCNPPENGIDHEECDRCHDRRNGKAAS